MATTTIIPAFTSFHGIRTQQASSSSSSCSCFNVSIPNRCVRRNVNVGVVKNSVRLRKKKYEIRAVDEETVDSSVVVEETAASADAPVSVPVSPSDLLTMFFQAEGTMNEAAIPSVTKALEQTEGIANLKVQVLEGIATVELAKQTTVQATGVASSLIEIIQGSGFKLQTLNLSFEDEEVVTV